MHSLPCTTSEVCVCGMAGNWLTAVKMLIETSEIIFNRHHSSSEAVLSPIGVIAMNGALAAIIECRFTENEKINAAIEVPSKLNVNANKALPLNQLSIPVFASCSSCATLHSVVYNQATTRFTQVQLRKYEWTIYEHRQRFLVDLFKILIWMINLQRSEQVQYLIPGAKRSTPNGHFVTLVRAGLLKQFGRNNIRLDLIERVYAAKLQHVERGTVNDSRSLTITSIGRPLHLAVRVRAVTNAEDVIRQLRLAVDELHNVGVSHCYICTDNMFVLDDGTVILGDLEYCTENNSLHLR